MPRGQNLGVGQDRGEYAFVCLRAFVGHEALGVSRQVDEVFGGAAALCDNALAWGDLGHKVICEIAFRLVQPDTRAAVRRLIETDTEFKTFADSCVFPDHPRRARSANVESSRRIIF
jgi:S1/P1 Nuclease